MHKIAILYKIKLFYALLFMHFNFFFSPTTECGLDVSSHSAILNNQKVFDDENKLKMFDEEIHSHFIESISLNRYEIKSINGSHKII